MDRLAEAAADASESAAAQAAPKNEQLTKVEKSLRKRLDARVRQLDKMRVKGEDLALYQQSVIAAGNLLNATVGRPAFQLVKDAAGAYKVGKGEAVAPTGPPPLPLAMFVDTNAGGASQTSTNYCILHL